MQLEAARIFGPGKPDASLEFGLNAWLAAAPLRIRKSSYKFMNSFLRPAIGRFILSTMKSAAEAISLGRQAGNEGNLAVAREHYAEGARISREQHDLLGYAHTIRHVADIHRKEGNLVEAKSLYEEALALYRGNLDTKLLDLANTVRPYALLNEEQGDADLARQLWEEAKCLYASLRIHEGVSECEAHIARLQQS